jgi:hypothetical protein
MTKITFSPYYLETTAKTLAFSLERNNIFPPVLNDPNIILQNKRPISQRKRPPNAFFICRMNVQKEVTRNDFNLKYNMRIVSKAASILWNSASPEEKIQYFLIANTVKELYSNSMQKTIDNPYNPYYNFQLSSQSHAIKIDQDTSEIMYFQTLEYYFSNLLLSNSEIFLNEL